MTRQITFVGDVHAKVEKFTEIATDVMHNIDPWEDKQTEEYLIQVGDMGFGFAPITCYNRNYVYLLRGNHDNPAIARTHPNYLGDWGVKTIGDHEIFYVSGAWSIDHQQRVTGRDWWFEEELSYSELNDAVDLYLRKRPDIVVSHDAPYSVTGLILDRLAIGNQMPTTGLDGGPYRPASDRGQVKTRTGTALQVMFEYHQPKVWVFGHYHIAWQKQIGRTLFFCLPELGTITLENLMAARSTFD